MAEALSVEPPAKRRHMDTKHRNFTFTAQTQKEIDSIACMLKWSYFIAGQKKDPETDHIVWHGYIQLVYSVTSSFFQETFAESTTISGRPATSIAASYIADLKNIPFKKELGQPHGLCYIERTDIDVMTDIIRDGGRLSDAKDVAPHIFTLNHHRLQFVFYTLQPKRRWKTKVTYIWGPRSRGKYTFVKEQVNKKDVLWIHRKYSKRPWPWTPHYEGQTHVVWLNMREKQTTKETLQRLFDEEPCTLHHRWGPVEFLARKIWVTSNVPPEDLFPTCTPNEKEALLRRIETVIHMPVRGRVIYHKYYNILTIPLSDTHLTRATFRDTPPFAMALGEYLSPPSPMDALTHDAFQRYQASTCPCWDKPLDCFPEADWD